MFVVPPVLLRLGVSYGEEETTFKARNTQFTHPTGDLHHCKFDDRPGDGALADQVLETDTCFKDVCRFLEDR
jgi:hypothetical protein